MSGIHSRVGLEAKNAGTLRAPAFLPELSALQKAQADLRVRGLCGLSCGGRLYPYGAGPCHLAVGAGSWTGYLAEKVVRRERFDYTVVEVATVLVEPDDYLLVSGDGNEHDAGQ